MRSRLLPFGFIASTALLICVVGACAESLPVGVTEEAGAAPTVGMLPPPTEAGVQNEAEAGSPAGAPRCSGDLRYVLDGSRRIVTECSPTEGCLDAKCVPACEAAAGAHGSIGCDFIVTTPSTRIKPPCHAVGITNTSRSLMHVEVSRDGVVFDTPTIGRILRTPSDPAIGIAASYSPLTTYGVPAGETLVVFLSGDGTGVVQDLNKLYYGENATISTECPFPKAVSGSTAVHVPLATPIGEQDGHDDATGRGKAFRIRTNVPGALVDVAPYDWRLTQQAGKANLLPVSAWGTRYVAISPNAIPAVDPVAFPPEQTYRPNFTHVVAANDGTIVTVTPVGADLPSGAGVIAAPHATKTTFTLAAGEYIQWQGVFDMTGSVVESNKPIGVVVGSPFSGYLASAGEPGTHYATAGLQRADATSGAYATHAPILPVSGLGSAYVGLHLFEFAMNSPVLAGYRIVGAVDGTRLTFDPQPLSIKKTTLDAGESIAFAFIGAISVKSQDAAHPFLMAQQGGGCWANHGGDEFDDCRGGGGYLRLVPPVDRWLTRAPAHDTDTLGVNYVRQRGPDGTFQPLLAVCRDGTSRAMTCNFHPVGGFTDFEFAALGSFIGGSGAVSGCSRENLFGCDVHYYESAAPFMVSGFRDSTYGPAIAWTAPFGGKGAASAVPAISSSTPPGTAK